MQGPPSLQTLAHRAERQQLGTSAGALHLTGQMRGKLERPARVVAQRTEHSGLVDASHLGDLLGHSIAVISAGKQRGLGKELARTGAL